jgi:hypothetical protein
MAATSALSIVCRSGCDLSSMSIVVFVLGLTTPVPRIGLLLICEPSVYTTPWGFHFWMQGLV